MASLILCRVMCGTVMQSIVHNPPPDARYPGVRSVLTRTVTVPAITASGAASLASIGIKINV